MESKNNWTTFVFAFAVPSGDKAFSKFQKGFLKARILKVSKPFLKHNNMERISNGPHWVLLSQSPFGGIKFTNSKNWFKESSTSFLCIRKFDSKLGVEVSIFELTIKIIYVWTSHILFQSY